MYCILCVCSFSNNINATNMSDGTTSTSSYKCVIMSNMYTSAYTLYFMSKAKSILVFLDCFPPKIESNLNLNSTEYWPWIVKTEVLQWCWRQDDLPFQESAQHYAVWKTTTEKHVLTRLRKCVKNDKPLYIFLGMVYIARILKVQRIQNRFRTDLQTLTDCSGLSLDMCPKGIGPVSLPRQADPRLSETVGGATGSVTVPIPNSSTNCLTQPSVHLPW